MIIFVVILAKKKKKEKHESIQTGFPGKKNYCNEKQGCQFVSI